MAERHARTNPGETARDRSGASWTGAGLAHDRRGGESDVPSGEPDATAAELRDAARKSLEQPGGERGDFGDSGPGED